MSVFVEHICVSVEATIVGEDRFHWRLLNQCGVGLVHVWRRHDGKLLLLFTDHVIGLEAFVVVRVEVFGFPL